jgi:hypothetical protein
MAKTRKIRLSGPQLEALKSLPRRMIARYKPARHLVAIGFATETENSFGNNLYEITPAGLAFLAESEKK